VELLDELERPLPVPPPNPPPVPPPVPPVRVWAPAGRVRLAPTKTARNVAI
jgi:hypothetical protein